MILSVVGIGNSYREKIKENIGRFIKKGWEVHILTDKPNDFIGFNTKEYNEPIFSYIDKLIFALELSKTFMKNVVYIDATWLGNLSDDFVEKFEGEEDFLYKSTWNNGDYLSNYLDSGYWSIFKKFIDKTPIKCENILAIEERILYFPYHEKTQNIIDTIKELKPIFEEMSKTQKTKYYPNIGNGEGVALGYAFLKNGINLNRFNPKYYGVMNTEDKYIIYTYVPPKQDWIDNKKFYLFELFSMLYSIETFKKNFKCKGFKLYSTPEICNFFKDTEYFVELIDITIHEEYIKNQDGGFNHPNMLYKMFVVDYQEEPFLHLDNDLYLNYGGTFHGVINKVLFAYEENVINYYLNLQFYNFYFKTYKSILKELTEEELEDMGTFNPISALNCCIFGTDDHTILKESFGKSNSFFIKHFEKLNKIPNIPGFIEQYLQCSFLTEKVPIDFISLLGDKIKIGFEMEDAELINSKKDYENLDPILLKKTRDYLTEPNNVHLSFMRWSPYFKIIIYNLLLEINPKMVKLIEDTYGKYEWMIKYNTNKKNLI
jgi:hypothetical protein